MCNEKLNIHLMLMLNIKCITTFCSNHSFHKDDSSHCSFRVCYTRVCAIYSYIAFPYV